MASPETWVWSIRGILDSDDEEWRPPSYVTDVVFRDARPPDGSRLIGIHNSGRGPEIRALGVVRRWRFVGTGKTSIRVDPLLVCDAIPLSAIADRVSSRVANRLMSASADAVPLMPQRLSLRASQDVLHAIRNASGRVSEWLDSLDQVPAPVNGREGGRLREERDAVGLALELADVEPDGGALSPQPPTDAAIGLRSAFAAHALADNEDDLLAEDLRRFDLSGTISLESASVARVVDDGFALTILNVNRKPLERVLGVDLVYWDTTSDVFTMLQYKRLTKDEKVSYQEEPWRYTRRQELLDQLQLMDVGTHQPGTSSEWRLHASPFWFKFIRTDAFKPGDRMVLPGMYVPADYLRMAIADGSLRTGPKRGFEVTYGNTRYLNRRTFVDLVRQRMTGTAGAQTVNVLKAVAARSVDHEVVLALKTAI